jgi:signal transduction histidine kinase
MTQKQPGKSGFATFLPRARLLRLIGAELISDDVVAITELVKNAHDADASFISIQFSNVATPGGEILIRDDGHGMDVDTLLTRWMQPAASNKGRKGFRFTQGGRRVLGEKGVGRFAADKLAARLEMVSRKKGESDEVHAIFDWDEFEADDLMLSDVKSRWEVRPADWLDSRGTMLRLTHLRTTWSERMFRRLSTRLARLMSPFDAKAGFRIVIQSDEFPAYSGEVSQGFLEQAPYRVEASLNEDGSATVRVNGGKSQRHVLSTEEPYRCGTVNLRLFAFDLETESLAKIGPRTDVRAWLRDWSGISVYRDSFRVWPYGEPHDDWLRLDQRRVNNPVVKLSNNQIVGFVEIGSDRNPELRDQTNREGLIHNSAYEDLQRFILFAMQLMEAERQTLRHPKVRETKRSEPADSGVPSQLDSLAARAPKAIASELRKIATNLRGEISAERQAQEKLVESYTELAAIGQTASLVGRSMATCLEGVEAVYATLRELYRKDNFDDVVKKGQALLALRGTIENVSVRLRSLTELQGVAKRRRALDLVVELERLRDLATPLLVENEATMSINVKKSEAMVLRTEMRPEMFASVIGAMLMNSVEWRHARKPLSIEVALRTRDKDVEIFFADNGKGIRPGLETNIFTPMVSGSDDGNGMGLAVARRIIEKHGGSLDLVLDGRRKGTTFRILLPRKRARATLQ